MLDLSERHLPRQLRHPPALRPRPPARRPPPGPAPGGPRRRADAARARALRRRRRSRRWTASSTPRCGRSPRPRSEPAAGSARLGRSGLRRSAARSTRRPGSAASPARGGGSTSPPASSTSPTRFANACSSSSSLRPIGRLARAASAITPSSRPPPIIGAAISAPRARSSRRRAAAAAARGARAPRGRAGRRRARPRPAARGSRGARPRATRRSDSPSSSVEVDGAAVDVVERDQAGRASSSAPPTGSAGDAAAGAAGRPVAGAGSGSAVISRCCSASATACERVEAPSFAIALRTWVRTVSGESTSFSAIWAPLMPSASGAEDLALAPGQRDARPAALRSSPPVRSRWICESHRRIPRAAESTTTRFEVMQDRIPGISRPRRVDWARVSAAQHGLRVNSAVSDLRCGQSSRRRHEAEAGGKAAERWQGDRNLNTLPELRLAAATAAVRAASIVASCAFAARCRRPAATARGARPTQQYSAQSRAASRRVGRRGESERRLGQRHRRPAVHGPRRRAARAVAAGCCSPGSCCRAPAARTSRRRS